MPWSYPIATSQIGLQIRAKSVVVLAMLSLAIERSDRTHHLSFGNRIHVFVNSSLISHGSTFWTYTIYTRCWSTICHFFTNYGRKIAKILLTFSFLEWKYYWVKTCRGSSHLKEVRHPITHAPIMKNRCSFARLHGPFIWVVSNVKLMLGDQLAK